MNKTKQKKIIEHVVYGVIKPKPHEKVLLITSENEEPFSVARLLYDAFSCVCAETTLLIQPPRPFEAPMNELTYMAIKSAPDIVMEVDVDTLGHDGIGKLSPHTLGDVKSNNILYFLKNLKKIRAFWFLVSDIDHFMQSLDIDLDMLKQRTDNLTKILVDAKQAIILSGEDATLTIDLYKQIDKLGISSYTGHEDIPGSGGNLPLGEIYATPVPGSAFGSIVIDSCYVDEWKGVTVFLDHPLTLYFDGYFTRVTGEKKEVAAFKKFMRTSHKMTDAMLEEKQIDVKLYSVYKKNIGNVGELGIGLNPACRFADDLLFAEKVLGSCHIALGRSYHGDVAMVHSDMVVKKPTLNLIMNDGNSTTVIQDGIFML